MVKDKHIVDFILSLLPIIEDPATLQEIIVACKHRIGTIIIDELVYKPIEEGKE